jgi:hypothetical protein
MMNKKNLLTTILFWGSLWGFIEATLGWGFHKLHFHGDSTILYTFGIFCMLSCASRTGKGGKAVFGTAIVASAIKLMDLLMPFTYRGAINPAMYILMEGALMAILSQFITVQVPYKSNLGHFEYRLAVPVMLVAAVFTLWLG